MPDIPTMPDGTVTFLFTDIEGSTRLWERHPRAMQVALALHDALLREAIETNRGYVFKTVGDAFCAAFPTAPEAISAALAAQHSLHTADWGSVGPLRVRMALHTGSAEMRDNDYFGLPLNRTARLLSTGYGSQILLSLATQQLVRDHLPPATDLKDLGEGGLKDLVRPEHVYQLVAPDLPTDFPPLKSLDASYIEPSTSDGSGLHNPYKGLRAFQEVDANDFFGREALTERLLLRLGKSEDGSGGAEAGAEVERAEGARFLAVVGPSGSGKSSVVRAGMVPALRRGELPGSDRWLIVELLPGAHPLEELEAVLLSIAVNPPESLINQLREDERGLVRAVKRVLPRDETVELVLMIDQFEEVFTLVEDEDERAHFLDSLLAAVTDPRSRLRVIITLRADFYDRPLLYGGFGDLMRQHTEVVLPLSADELERAVARPAIRLRVTPEAELVATIVQDVGEQPGALPLLQYALTELFERRAGRLLTLEAYQATGGVLGALGKRAEEIYAGLGRAEQEAARQLFLRMVTLGEGAEDTRRRVRRAELGSIVGDATMLDRVLDAFGRYRLLTFDRDPVTHGPTVEVAHEALIRTWGRLREWLDASRADLRVQRQLMVAATDWASAGQDPSFLASGARLAQFEALAEEGDLALNEEERAYLQASVVEQDKQEVAERERQARELTLQKRAARRLRYLVVGLGLFLVVAIALSGWAVNRSQVAEASLAQSESQRLAAEANRLLATKSSSEVAALLSIQALRLSYSPSADEALVQAADLEYPQRVFERYIDEVYDARFFLDGKRLLVSAHAATSTQPLLPIEVVEVVWNAQTGAQLSNNSIAKSRCASYSPDGRYVLTCEDDIAKISDVKTEQEIHQFASRAGIVTAAFSPDAKHMLTSNSDNTAQLWDIETGQEVRRFAGGYTVLGDKSPYSGDKSPYKVVFSPDAKYALTLTNPEHTVLMWDLETGQQIRQLSVLGATVYDVAFSPDGKSILTGQSDNVAHLWDATAGREIRRFIGHKSLITAVAFSPDGKYVLTGSYDKTARLWDVQTGTEIRIYGGTAPLRGVAFSPDGKYVLTNYDGKSVQLWSTEPATSRTFAGPSGAGAWAAGFSQDQKYVITSNRDNTIRLWSRQTGLEVRLFKIDRHAIDTGSLANQPEETYHATLSPDDKYLLANLIKRIGTETYFTRTNVVVMWEVESGKQLREVPDDEVGKLLGVDNADQWRGRFNGVPKYSLEFYRYGETMAGNPELDKLIKTSKNDRSVLVLKLLISSFGEDAKPPTVNEIRRLRGHTDRVNFAQLSRDGKYVLTGSEDLTARLWDPDTGRQLRIFVGHTAGVTNGIFSPDGQYVLTGSDDGTVRLWDVNYHDTITWVCSRLLRDFTDDERALYNIKDKEPTCGKQ